MQYICLTRLARTHPQQWNQVWRTIKKDAPSIAAHIADPFHKELRERFSAEIDLPLDSLPKSVIDLLPAESIIN